MGESCDLVEQGILLMGAARSTAADFDPPRMV